MLSLRDFNEDCKITRRLNIESKAINHNWQEGGVVEHGQFLVGSLTDDGQVTLLPSLGGEQVS